MLKRNIFIASRGGMVGRISYDIATGKAMAKSFESSALNILVETLKVANEHPQFEGAALNIFTLTDITIKVRMFKKAVRKAHGNMEQGKATVMAFINSRHEGDEYSVLCSELFDLLIAMPRVNIDNINAFDSKPKNDLFANRMRRLTAEAWKMCPLPELQIVNEDGDTDDEFAEFAM